VGDDVLSQITGAISSMGNNVVQTLYQSLAASFAPAFWLLVTIYIAWWGYEMLLGRARVSGGEMLWRLLRIGVIYAFALGWSDFRSIAVNGLQGLTSGMGNAVCQAVASVAPTTAGSDAASGLAGSWGTNCIGNGSSASSGVTLTLSEIWNSSMNTISGLKGSGWTGPIVMALLQLFLFGVVVAFVGYALFLIIVGILATQALLGVAPLFVTAALFGFTNRFFSGWLSTVLSYALTPVLVYTFVGFMSVLLQQQSATLMVAGADPSFTQVAPFVLMCIIATFLLTQSKPIAASIASGHLIQGLNGLFWTMSGAAAAGALWRNARRNQRDRGDGARQAQDAKRQLQNVLMHNRTRGLTNLGPDVAGT